LAWADIELDSQPHTITIRRSWRGDPKSEHSATTLPLSDDAAAILRQWKAEQGETVYVFPSSKGELRTSTKRKEVIAISKAAQEAGITCKVTPHVFRHTFATWTYECGKDPRKLQRLLRHASFDTNMGYVHENADLTSLVNQLPAVSRPRLKAA
jgi:integrase